MRWISWFEHLSLADVASVGGKNASLGELLRGLGARGVRVPGGFATTADAFRAFLTYNQLETPIAERLALRAQGKATLEETGAAIRALIRAGRLPEEEEAAIRSAYQELGDREADVDVPVAVRSSATAEDLPDASFAGQHDSFLDIRGESALLDAVVRCYASVYTDRAIVYRERQGYAHAAVALSVGVQRMVAADAAGVAFSLDIDTGFPRIVLVNATWGLGEPVVQGTVEPDQYRVYAPFLDGAGQPVIERWIGSKVRTCVARDGAVHDEDTPPERRDVQVLGDAEIVELARAVVAIHDHYGGPMDVEWAREVGTGALFVVQARPETVEGRRAAGPLVSWELREPGVVRLSGLAVGHAIAAGRVRVLRDRADAADFRAGEVLVTTMTSPDWVPVMRRAAAIVTDHGGRTSHAAIVSRELGVPAVIGTGNATEVLHDGEEVTVSCARGDGRVYAGRLRFESTAVSLAGLPTTRTRVMLNVGSPEAALAAWRLPVSGIGLARMEYLISGVLRVHPMAAAHPERLDAATRAEIAALVRGATDPAAWFVDRLAEGIAVIAASRYPAPVVVRLSDFKTNEYARLLGGAPFEPHEENPMLGWRGASRYDDDRYRDGFALECRALKRVREAGFRNVVVMVPFCRTPAEADRVLAVMARFGLRRGEEGLEVWGMAEIPSNVLEAEAFAERFDGFSIGSNDLTQLVLGVSRDEERLRGLFDERSPSVTWMIRELVRRAHAVGRTVGFCGQAPSDDPTFAAFLVEAGVDSISVDADSVARVIEHVARAEQPAKVPEPA